MLESFSLKGKRYEDRRGKTYAVITVARDVQTAENIVVYRQEWGDEEVLCCPMDAFNMSMKPVSESDPSVSDSVIRRPKNGEERMLAFLDTDDFIEKQVLLKEIFIRGEMTNSIIDNLAAALDVVIDEGDIQTRFDQLKICVDTRARFETTRLR